MSETSEINTKSAPVGVMIIGLKGAVATTLFCAGLAARHGLAGGLALPSERDPATRDLTLTPLSEMRFGGWDIASTNLADSLTHHAVLPRALIDQVTPHLDEVWSRPGLYLHDTPIHGELDADRRGAGDVVSLRALTDQIRADIQEFKRARGVERVVIIDLASTAPALRDAPAHHTLAAFEAALDGDPRAALDGEHLSAGSLYAYAALQEGCPCVNFTPSTTFDLPALLELAELRGVPVCGKDGKTGQTLYKTVLAPMFRQRALKVRGWYSTNILGNRDGEVLDHPEHRKTKIESKVSVLAELLDEDADTLDHQVHIHYYKPRGDAKEAWDNIDFEGWFGVPMQMKVNWLGSDSILAAPLAADLVRWMIYFQDRGEAGVISALSSYFKSPLGADTHDFYAQVSALHGALDDK